VISLDTSLGEEFLDVVIGQPEAQVPADRQDNHVGWEAEAGEGGPRGGSRRGRRVLMAAVSLLGRGRRRCNSALGGWRRLRIRYERSSERFSALVLLACPVICFNALHQPPR
jgi:hypothetical protein